MQEMMAKITEFLNNNRTSLSEKTSTITNISTTLQHTITAGQQTVCFFCIGGKKFTRFEDTNISKFKAQFLENSLLQLCKNPTKRPHPKDPTGGY